MCSKSILYAALVNCTGYYERTRMATCQRTCDIPKALTTPHQSIRASLRGESWGNSLQLSSYSNETIGTIDCSYSFQINMKILSNIIQNRTRYISYRNMIILFGKQTMKLFNNKQHYSSINNFIQMLAM